MSLKAKDGYILAVNDVSKRFGKQWVLKEVSFFLGEGEIVGFVGPNGAGKTTLIRILAGLDFPTIGNVKVPVEGLIPNSPGIGLVMETAPFIDHLTGYRNLEILAYIRNIIGSSEIKRALIQVGLNPEDRKKVKHYSFGMRQRLALAQAIMEFPRLLLLDEPTKGLDAQAIIELRDILKVLAKEKGIAILLASHLLTEVEKVCDRVLMVKEGQILKTFSREAEFSGKPVSIQVTGKEDLDKVCSWASESCIDYVVLEPFEAILSTNYSVPEIINALVERGVSLEGVAKKSPSLEEEFINLLIGGKA